MLSISMCVNLRNAANPPGKGKSPNLKGTDPSIEGIKTGEDEEEGDAAEGGRLPNEPPEGELFPPEGVVMGLPQELWPGVLVRGGW